MLKNNEDGDKYLYNISPAATREKFPEIEEDVFDEKWVDYVFKTISCSRYSAVVLENIFTRVTTGNYLYYLPYQEQLRVIVDKIKKYNLQDRIVALVRGAREMEIINSTLDKKGPDLMKMLGEALKIPERVTGSRVILEMQLKNTYKKNPPIRLTNYNSTSRVNKGIFSKMISFIESEPGFDIYWNSSAKVSGQEDAFIKHDKKNPQKTKPCTALFFGPMCYFDKFNAYRDNLSPYPLNHTWFKIHYTNTLSKGKNNSTEVESVVRVDFNDYNAPVEEKIDDSNYVSSVASDIIGEALENIAKSGIVNVINNIENAFIKDRKDFNSIIKEQKIATHLKDVKYSPSAIIMKRPNNSQGREQ
jgi:hypothetical protein